MITTIWLWSKPATKTDQTTNQSNNQSNNSNRRRTKEGTLIYENQNQLPDGRLGRPTIGKLAIRFDEWR